MVRLLEAPKPGTLPPIKFVQVMTHGRCNAACRMCPHPESWHKNNPGTMTDETWARVIQNLAPFKAGIESGKFCPYLKNEPLIDVSIFRKIDDIYAVFPRTCVEVSTNGEALTSKVIDKLLERFAGRRHDIWVSHHGIDRESLEAIMEISYEKSTANLINLIKKSDGRFQIRIRGTGADQFGINTWFTRQQYLDYWRDMADKHSLNMQNVELDYFLHHDRAGEIHRIEKGANLLNSGKLRDIGPGHKPFSCPRIDEWVHIEYDGQLSICCMSYSRSELKDVKLPNLNDVWLLDYFFGPEYRDLVDKVSGRKESSEDFICKRCFSPGG